MTALRDAAIADVPTLVRHRRLMYEDMAVAQSLTFRPEELDGLDRDYATYLRQRLAGGTVRASLAEAGGRVVASGCVTMLAMPPSPGLPAEHTALLHSMYTEPEFRRRGLGRAIVEAAIAFCRQDGRKFMILGGPGTNAGRHLYETLGFKPAENARLTL